MASLNKGHLVHSMLMVCVRPPQEKIPQQRLLRQVWVWETCSPESMHKCFEKWRFSSFGDTGNVVTRQSYRQIIWMRSKFGLKSVFRVTLYLSVVATVFKKCSERRKCTLEMQSSAIKAEQDKHKDINAWRLIQSLFKKLHCRTPCSARGPWSLQRKTSVFSDVSGSASVYATQFWPF